MSCGDSPIFIVAGSTWNDVTFEYKDDPDAVIPLTGLNARGVLRNADNTVVLTLTSAGGTPNLVIDALAGTVTPNVASTATGALAAGNVKTPLTLYLELYDAGSPVVVTPFGQYDVVVQPDEIP